MVLDDHVLRLPEDRFHATHFRPGRAAVRGAYADMFPAVAIAGDDPEPGWPAMLADAAPAAPERDEKGAVIPVRLRTGKGAGPEAVIVRDAKAHAALFRFRGFFAMSMLLTLPISTAIRF